MSRAVRTTALAVALSGAACLDFVDLPPEPAREPSSITVAVESRVGAEPLTRELETRVNLYAGRANSEVRPLLDSAVVFMGVRVAPSPAPVLEGNFQWAARDTVTVDTVTMVLPVVAGIPTTSLRIPFMHLGSIDPVLPDSTATLNFPTRMTSPTDTTFEFLRVTWVLQLRPDSAGSQGSVSLSGSALPQEIQVPVSLFGPRHSTRLVDSTKLVDPTELAGPTELTGTLRIHSSYRGHRGGLDQLIILTITEETAISARIP